MYQQTLINSQATLYPKRKRKRLSSYDYSIGGYYFLTICTLKRQCFFGEIINNQMICNNAGEMITYIWEDLQQRFDQVIVDDFILMPNHLHGIIALEEGVSLSQVIQAFKSLSTNAYIQGVHQQGWTSFDKTLWQRSYYDHVIRDDKDMYRVKEYILNNPKQWSMDVENPFRKDVLKAGPT